MTKDKPKQDLYELNVGRHGTARTIEVTCIATNHVIARFDFEQDEDTAKEQATRFAEGLATVYYSGASIDLHGLLASDEHLDRMYCWPEPFIA